MSKVTYQEINTFLSVSFSWLNAKNEKGEKKNDDRSKLGWAIHRVRPRAEKLLAEYHDKVEDLRIDHCLADEKGVPIVDERGAYKFEKAELKKCNHAIQKLSQTEVEIEPHFATALPPNLSVTELLAFSGFVVKKEQVDEVEQGLEVSAQVEEEIAIAAV